jgi:hypothetical protein
MPRLRLAATGMLPSIKDARPAEHLLLDHPP